MKVLLVEDSPIILGFMHEVLLRAGVEVAGVTSVPQAAVNTLRERKPEAVLIDLDLRDALPLVKILVAEGPGLFVIGYAGNCTESLVIEAREVGVGDLLAKPLGESRLLEALEKCRGLRPEEPVRDEGASEPAASAEKETPSAAAPEAPAKDDGVDGSEAAGAGS